MLEFPERVQVMEKTDRVKRAPSRRVPTDVSATRQLCRVVMMILLSQLEQHAKPLP